MVVMARPRKDQLEQREALRAQGRKRCGHCRRILPLSDFGKHAGEWDSLQPSCRPCINEQIAASSARARERMGDRAYLDRKNVWIRKARATAISKVGVAVFNRRYNLSKYGLTSDEYDAVAKKQGGRCASCGNVPPPHSRSPRYPLEVDHDHKTGRTRELVCHGCNLGLAMFNDDPRRLRAAIRYLKRHNII